MTPALKITDLHKTYDNGFTALKGVSLEVQPGDFFALLGPNGAGKSTSIGIICSLVRKSGGSVEIFGRDIDTDFSTAKQDLGVVPQEFNFNQFEKVRDILITQAGYFGLPKPLAAERAEKYLRLLGLWEKRNSVSRMLSGGMKRRLMIARAMVHEPKLLILDEPTAGVDIELRRSMWDFLRKINAEGTTIILTTHYLEEAESLCRNIAIIDNGEIVQNTSIRQLLTQLNKEVFLLDVEGSLEQCPQLDGFPTRLVAEEDGNSLEVEVVKGQSLNDLFAALNKQGVRIQSMRNKANRLEEMFVSMTNNGKSEEQGGAQ